MDHVSNQVALTTYLLVHSTKNPEIFSEYEFDLIRLYIVSWDGTLQIIIWVNQKILNFIVDIRHTEKTEKTS